MPAPPPVVHPDAAPRDADTVTDWTSGEEPRCPALPRAELETCLRVHSPCSARVEDIPNSAVENLSLIRVSCGTTAEIYVMVKHGSLFHAIKEVFAEDETSVHRSTFKLVQVGDHFDAGPRVTKIDFTTEVIAVADHTIGPKWYKHFGAGSMRCTWPAGDGEPVCKRTNSLSLR